MADIARLYDFEPSTTIKSSEVDDELNQIVTTINDLDDDNISASAEIAQSKISNTIRVIDADKVDGFNANATPTASNLLPLDSDKNFPVSVIKDGTFPLAKLKIYESAWTACVAPSTHTFDHGLGVMPKFVQILISDKDDATRTWCIELPQFDPEYGVYSNLVDLTTTQIVLRFQGVTHGYIAMFYDKEGVLKTPTSGFCKITALA